MSTMLIPRTESLCILLDPPLSLQLVFTGFHVGADQAKLIVAALTFHSAGGWDDQDLMAATLLEISCVRERSVHQHEILEDPGG